MRYFFADGWPERLWFWIVPLAVPVAVWWVVSPLPWIISHWLNALAFAGVLLLAWAVGVLAAIIPGWLVLGPLYFSQARDNGAPYRVGDHVRVLSRRRRGLVARVSDVWECRAEVRL